jgi:hypothetical protein
MFYRRLTDGAVTAADDAPVKDLIAYIQRGVR